PDELWLAIRQYLTRMHQLDPGVGGSIAGRLADEFVTRAGIAPPQGVPAAAFLAAVVHERQARDARRVFAGARNASSAPPAPPAPSVLPGATGFAAPATPPAPVGPVADGSGAAGGPRPGHGTGQEGAGASSAGFAPPG
ncbi:RDD family protein, partial [Streptomyces microflavus]